MTETISVSDGEDDVGCPSQWNVEQVFSYINSLPGTVKNFLELINKQNMFFPNLSMFHFSAFDFLQLIINKNKQQKHINV